MADEALECFATLIESIPAWIAELEDILRTAAERQKQILFENQPSQDEQVFERLRKPSKTSSIHSKRSIDVRPDLPTASDVEVTPARKQVPHMTQSDALRLAQRKRKTASAISDDEQAPYKYRSRAMAVVYYDGETQQQFEGMVRKIGNSRNSLRKGKIKARFDLISTPGLHPDNGTESDGSIELPKVSFRSARGRRQPGTESNDGTEAFDRIDALLDKAQSMCERAAHQVLRDGDCALEIKHANDHFAEARKLSEVEISIWEKRSKDAVERAKASSLRERNMAGAATDTGLGAQSSSEERLGTDKQSISTPGSLEADLEVDDSDRTEEEPVPLDLTQFKQQYSKRSCLRSAGLTARCGGD